MKTVNEIVFGRPMDSRPEWEQVFYIDNLREMLAKPENRKMREIHRKIMNAGLKNVGEQGSLELLGAVALFLTQVPDSRVRDLEIARYKKRDQR